MQPLASNAARWLFLISLATCFPQFPTDSLAQELNKPLSVTAIKRTIGRLKSLDQDLPDPEPGEWLDHQKETGQLFNRYPGIQPNVLTATRRTLYIQPIGTFTGTEERLMKQTRQYLEVYFHCPVKLLDPLDPATIPESARRKHPQWGDPQLLTTYILEEMLAPKLPADAFATIAFTNQDLWPGEGWNFVFGFAAYRERVGVWSLYRFGNPDQDKATYRKCLWRMIKLATHETGHMFSMRHCTHAQCNMQGSNHLQESDTQPLHLCSQCHAKTLFATGAEPVSRFEKLLALCQEFGFEQEVRHYQAAIDLLKSR